MSNNYKYARHWRYILFVSEIAYTAVVSMYLVVAKVVITCNMNA